MLQKKEFRDKCAMIKLFGKKLDPLSTDNARCPDIVLSDEVKAWVHPMIRWFRRQTKQQDVYKYHGVIHNSLFGSSMYLMMTHANAYAESDEGIAKRYHTFSDEDIMAGTIAGLYHDVGYVLMPRWLYCLNLCAATEGIRLIKPELALCGQPDHKGHELASLIAAMYLFIKNTVGAGVEVPNLKRILDVMAHTILPTKITGSFPQLRGSDVTEALAVLDRRVVGDGSTVFDNAKFYGTQNLIPELITRSRHLIACVRAIYHGTTRPAECVLMTRLIDNHESYAVGADESRRLGVNWGTSFDANCPR
jgi:hypothetical protein